jgi:hypothetical protein
MEEEKVRRQKVEPILELSETKRSRSFKERFVAE